MRIVDGGSSGLAVMQAQIGSVSPPDPVKQRAAAINTAEAAIAGGWSRDELVDVLAALGVDGASS